MLALQLHDLANSAAGVNGLLMLLRSDGYDPDLVEQAYAASARLVEAIDRMRAAIRAGRPGAAADVRMVEARVLLESVRVEGVGLAAISGCGWECAVSPSAWVLADPILIHRAMVNLVKNAIEACPRDGTVRMSVCVLGRHCRFVVWHPGVIAEREPSASCGCGTRGLGLHAVRSVVEQHQDAVHGWHSVSGEGTSFWIYLPLVQPDSVSHRVSGVGLS